MSTIPKRQKHIYDYFIDEHGNWFCEGNPVDDKDLFKILSRSLFKEGDRYFIRCEGEVHPVRVADAPLWVKYVHLTPSADGKEINAVEIELTDGRREILNPETLSIKGDSAIYCLATKKKLPARFGKVAYYEFAKLLNWSDEEKRYYVRIGNKKYFLKQL